MTQKNRQAQLFSNDAQFDALVQFNGAVPVAKVAAGGTLTIDPLVHDGRTIYLDTASGSVITLPAATGSGARYRFLVSVTPTTNAHLLNAAGTDEFHGHMLQTDVDTTDTLASYPAIAADDFDVVSLNGTTSGGLTGDEIVIEDLIAGVWFVKGTINSNGTVVTPFSST